MNKVVEILKESGHEIALVLRMGIVSSEPSKEEEVTTEPDRAGSCDSLEQPTNQNPSPPVDLGTNNIITRSTPEEETDLGAHCSSKQETDASTPRTSRKKRKKPQTLPMQEADENDSSACSSPAIERSGSGKSHSQTSSFGLRLQSMAHIHAASYYH